jgi:anti-sigma regulatory factor (Ser/Thr protein kinase)
MSIQRRSSGKMTIVTKSYREMLRESGPGKILIDDKISPESNPEIFDQGYKEEGIFGGPSRKYIDKVLDKMDLDEDSKKGLRLALAEAITNAVEWGNNANRHLPVRIRVIRCIKDYILRFQDSGNGFPYMEKVQQLRSGGKYYHRGGSGLGTLELEAIEASFDCPGNILNIRKRREPTVPWRR